MLYVFPAAPDFQRSESVGLTRTADCLAGPLKCVATCSGSHAEEAASVTRKTGGKPARLQFALDYSLFGPHHRRNDLEDLGDNDSSCVQIVINEKSA